MTATISVFQIIVQVVISMYKQVSRHLQMEGFFFSFLLNTAFTEEKKSKCKLFLSRARLQRYILLRLTGPTSIANEISKQDGR
jgi:hypothetical protein